MNAAFLSNLGRILFSLPFVLFGAFHLMDPRKMAAMVPAWVPGGGSLWVILTGLFLVLAGVAFLLNRFVVPAALLLAALLLAFILTIHIPNTMNADANIKAMGMVGLLKDLGLLGGALMLAGKAKS
ncbi:MAG: DoxX family membrane protein [Spirochaetes bacterium]|nr:DoxX family membrane protein [Spirochaetota bacterium]